MSAKPSEVVFLVDSSCVMAAIKAQHCRISAYLANRKTQLQMLEYKQVWSFAYPDIQV